MGYGIRAYPSDLFSPYYLFKDPISGDFLGGAVVKNPPPNAGVTGSSPGPGRSHMLRRN